MFSLYKFSNKVFRFLFKTSLIEYSNRIGGEEIALKCIGERKWLDSDFKEKLQQFSEIYKNRPISDNTFGMKAPHIFLVWFVLQSLKPKAVIESGVYRGQGTWFIEKVAPSAEIHSIDINLSQREYISKKAIYYSKDFFSIDWSKLPKEQTLCFFDDHQNAVQRVKFAKENGFKVLIFEDNYPTGKGDCYSLKQAFDRGGDDAIYLEKIIKVYHELPPIFKSVNTRWGDKWDEKSYPTPNHLYDTVEKDYLQVYFDERESYTWMCYVELK